MSSESTNYHYIAPKYYNNVLNYKYSGGDNSILYVYIMNPIYEWAINYFPTWLAPNVLTVSGFFLNLAYNLAIFYYSGFGFTTYLPSWVGYFTAVTYTVYIMLDYMDGKQARRLKASSPMGMLIDHGTDACTTFYITMGLGSLLFLEDMKSYAQLYVMVVSAFFFNTWEAYYIGELVLPMINGVSEGTLLIILICVLSSLYGPEFYAQKYDLLFLKNCQLKELIALGGCASGIFFGVISYINVHLKRPSKDYLEINFNALIFALFLGAFYCVIYLSDSWIVKEWPKFLILTFGFLFAKIMGILHLAQTIGGVFVWTKPVFLVPLLSILSFSLLDFWKIPVPFVTIDHVIIFFFFFNFFSWVHYVYYCSEEFCEILNINRFVLGKRYNDREVRKKIY